MENSQLIAKLKELKNVSPRKEWVSLAKTQMFAEITPAMQVAQKATFGGILSNIFSKKQLAYSFAALLVVAVGLYGMVNFPITGGINGTQNTAALVLAETNLKNNVELLKATSQNLSEISKAKVKPADISVAVNAVKEVAKSITQTLKKDPELASKVALEVNNNKTYLDVAGGNASSEVEDMYKVIVVQMIKDLDGTTLSEDQETELARIKASLKTGNDYTTALRDILLISRAGENK